MSLVKSILPTVFSSVALSALLARACPPDQVAQAFILTGIDQPLIIHDELDIPFDTTGKGPSLSVFAHPTQLTHSHASPVALTDPTGLLVWAARARGVGIDRVRTVAIHPSLPYTVPALPAHARTHVATQPAVIIAEAARTSRAVITIGPEGHMHVFACAPVPYAPLGVTSASEAIRHLRQTVMQGLKTINSLDTEVPESIRNAAWRDWQSELAPGGPAGRVDTIVQQLGVLLDAGAKHRAPAKAQALYTALQIHDALRHILAPSSLQPQQLGQLLSELHPGAGDVITTVTREAPGGSQP